MVEPLDEEFLFEGRVIISETDANGTITFANRKFCEISGYEKAELIGQPHNLIRHPEMPKKAFEQMWNTIKSGQSWHGLVKNLRKNGQFYWVETEISPVRDEHGTIIGYIAARKPAGRKDIDDVVPLYQSMLESE